MKLFSFFIQCKQTMLKKIFKKLQHKIETTFWKLKRKINENSKNSKLNILSIFFLYSFYIFYYSYFEVSVHIKVFAWNECTNKY